MEPPDLNIKWIRGKANIDFARPNVLFALGMRGCGKSAFLELCASKYLDSGGKIFDLFSSRDGESLAWLRSPYAKTKRIILIRGDMVEIKSEHESIPASKFKVSDLDRADIFISTGPLYSDMDDEFSGVNHIIDILWKRHYWTQPIFLVVREAANLIYSRLKIRQNQNLAKSEVIYMLRESRHCGLALGLDSIKSTSIDIDIRVLTDYLIIKNTGIQSLPDELQWVYGIFDPHAIRRLKPSEFIILDRRGQAGLGVFEMPLWHKLENENIIKEVGLEVRYLQPSGEGDQARDTITEALQALPIEPSIENVVGWIKENKHETLGSLSIGRYIRGMGYRTEQRWIGGKLRTIILKLP